MSTLSQRVAAEVEPSVFSIFAEEISAILNEELEYRFSNDGQAAAFPGAGLEDRVALYLVMTAAHESDSARPYLLRLADAMRKCAGRIEEAFEG